MKLVRSRLLIACGVWFFLLAESASASIILAEYGMNLDGVSYCSASGCDNTFVPNLAVVPGVDDTGFDYSTGLGLIGVTISSPGAHYLSLYLDQDIDRDDNTYYNENGATLGAPAAGQSWEIDEPGFVFGDIFFNFLDGTLDNSNGVPSGFEDDPAMALAWDFVLTAGEIAMLTFSVAEISPAGFQLIQSDPDSLTSIFFSSSLSISPVAVSEPGTLGLMFVGLVALLMRRRAIGIEKMPGV